jgi:hypothetical protein
MDMRKTRRMISREDICRVSLYTIRLLLVSHAIPCQTCKRAAGDREKGWYVEVKASHKCACGHHRPKGIRSERRRSRFTLWASSRCVDVSDKEERVDRSIYKAGGSSIESAEDTPRPSILAPLLVDGKECKLEADAGREDANVAEDGTEHRV